MSSRAARTAARARCKVYEFQVPVAAYQYVLLAQITIHYIMLGVQVLEREDKLCSIKAGDIFAGAVRCAVVQVIEQLPAIDALLHHDKLNVILKHAHEPGYIGVVHLPHDFNLTRKRLHPIGAYLISLAQALGRVHEARRSVPHHLDAGKRAGSYRAEYLEIEAEGGRALAGRERRKRHVRAPEPAHPAEARARRGRKEGEDFVDDQGEPAVGVARLGARGAASVEVCAVGGGGGVALVGDHEVVEAKDARDLRVDLPRSAHRKPTSFFAH